MQLIFYDTPHYLQSILDNGSLNSSLRVFDEPLIVWNLKLIDSINKIDKILISEKNSETFQLIKENFPSTEVNYLTEETPDYSGNLENAPKNIDLSNLDKLELSINSAVFQLKGTTNIVIDVIKYPWDYLKIIQEIMNNHIFESKISSTAIIPKTTILNGPCIIEDGVEIDEFCKIKGPIFIGKNSFIGMGSLVRNCMLGANTSIGFNCEIAKCFFSGQADIAHHNVILDSVIGRNVWFGGYSGTANVLLTKKNVKFQIDDNLIDTGVNHFGAVVGNNSAVGAAVIILPGRQIQSDSVIQAGTILGKK